MLKVCALLIALAQFGQVNTGELRISVSGPDGMPMPALVRVMSDATQVQEQIATDASGTAVLKRLPFGRYHVTVTQSGFSPFNGTVDVESALPTRLPVVLAVAPVTAAVEVRGDTLLDTHSAAPVARIGRDALATRPASLPGRVLPDLVASQPGWLLEANGVLHPRGSEYQTQYVVDGLPMTDNRSPAFAPDAAGESAQSIAIITGGYPAEYGRKLGGIVEVVTEQEARRGWHGGVSAGGGSFGTADASGTAAYGWSRTEASVTAGAARTDRYLDPPVEENFTNHGSTSRIAARLDHDFSDADRFGAIVRHGAASLLVPNERVQQQAGQRQDRQSSETAGEYSYQHLTTRAAFDLRGMTRTLDATLASNPQSTPIVASQDRGFTETYLKATLGMQAGRHEWKTGGDVSLARAREAFAYDVTAPGVFDPDVPSTFTFADRRTDREAALFVQDQWRAGAWTVNAGLRWDTYHFVVDEQAVSPRIGVAWAPRADLVLRASYDRAFQTPAEENLLLASSQAVDALSDQVVRLPVRPSLGNFYEGGVSKTLAGSLRLDVTGYHRTETNFADDDVLLNTGVSFPIALDSAVVNGLDIAVTVPLHGRWSASAAYSLMKATARLPVTGGLLLGDDTGDALARVGETIPVSQDQRHTLHGRVNYQVTTSAWTALSASYGSGLPFEEFNGTQADALAQFGPRIAERVNFDSGRVRPRFSLDAAAGVALHARPALRLQVDVQNLTNRLDLIDFAGLFSGTALAPPRSVAVRLSAEF
ncbi:MAG TPA: TonB-dependent receptor [Vicinamibacterales bacterium]|nr:TonB-dependent receptor [Vicinamibacterales bacterium]